MTYLSGWLVVSLLTFFSCDLLTVTFLSNLVLGYTQPRGQPPGFSAALRHRPTARLFFYHHWKPELNLATDTRTSFDTGDPYPAQSWDVLRPSIEKVSPRRYHS